MSSRSSLQLLVTWRCAPPAQQPAHPAAAGRSQVFRLLAELTGLSLHDEKILLALRTSIPGVSTAVA